MKRFWHRVRSVTPISKTKSLNDRNALLKNNYNWLDVFSDLSPSEGVLHNIIARLYTYSLYEKKMVILFATAALYICCYPASDWLSNNRRIRLAINQLFLNWSNHARECVTNALTFRLQSYKQETSQWTNPNSFAKDI